jgi:excisionase family DNA binding protein
MERRRRDDQIGQVVNTPTLAELLGVHPWTVQVEARQRARRGEPYGRKVGKGWVFARWVVFGEDRPGDLGLPELLTPEEAAVFLGVDATTVRHAIRVGKLPHIRVTRQPQVPAPALSRVPRHPRIPASALLDWLESPEGSALRDPE